MNWPLFGIVLFFLMVLEMSIVDLVDIGGVRPALICILALYVALWAPRMGALWGCFICGLVIDLTSPIAFGGGQSAHILGPYALGSVFACALVLQVRSMVMRRQVFAIAVLAGIFVLATSIIVVAIYTVRSWYSPELGDFSPAHELFRRLAVSGYTALIAVPIGWVFLKSFGYWHFPASMPARTNWR